MTYGVDLRKRVLSYIEEGGSQRDAARLFKVSSRTIYNWRHRSDLRPSPARTRRRKLDKEALRRHVEEHPDAYLRERAAHFGVHINAIWVALDRLKASKKNEEI